MIIGFQKDRFVGVQIPTPPLISFVNLEKLSYLSAQIFLLCEIGKINAHQTRFNGV